MTVQPAAVARGATRQLLQGRRSAVIALSVTSFVGGIAEAAFLLVITRIAFALAAGNDQIDLWRQVSVDLAAGAAISLVVIRVVFALLAGRQSARLVSSVVAEIRAELADAFLNSKWIVQQASRSGRLQELLTTFVQKGADLLNAYTSFITAAFSLCALLIGALFANPLGSLVALVVLVVLAGFLRPTRRAIKRRARTASAAGMDFATSLSEVSTVALEIQVFNVEDRVGRVVGGRIDDAEKANYGLLFARSMIQPAYIGAAYTALVVALVVMYAIDTSALPSIAAVMVVMLRSLTYGQSLQVSSASVASNEPFVDELHRELGHLRSHRAGGGLERIDRIRTLELDAVSFRYGEGRSALTDVSATLHAGEAIGIVGPSGSGKSTLAQLILGLLEPECGELRADGREISTIARASWCRRVTFVPQSPSLIPGTIADNIRFYRDVSDEEVERAARLAHIHDEIVEMEGGYQRSLMNAGAVSGGQQQRICIARALVEDPDIIVLDEPTSALDVRSEHLIGETLAELRGQKTVVIIAHRLSTLRGCDRLMVVQDGRLVGFDSPAELEQTNEFYSEVLRLSGLTAR